MPKIGEFIRDRDWQGLAKSLLERHPKGMVGERDELVTELVKHGASHSEAVTAAREMEHGGYAHHLPGERGRWIFTSTPVSLRELMTLLDQEYAEYVGDADGARDEALVFISSRLGVDRNVAEEVLVGLESAGYTTVTFDPERMRDRLLITFPLAFRSV